MPPGHENPGGHRAVHWAVVCPEVFPKNPGAQAWGALEPPPQYLPAGQSTAVALVDPSGQ